MLAFPGNSQWAELCCGHWAFPAMWIFPDVFITITPLLHFPDEKGAQVSMGSSQHGQDPDLDMGGTLGCPWARAVSPAAPAAPFPSVPPPNLPSPQNNSVSPSESLRASEKHRSSTDYSMDSKKRKAEEKDSMSRYVSDRDGDLGDVLHTGCG